MGKYFLGQKTNPCYIAQNRAIPNGAQRIIPLFPELAEPLNAVFATRQQDSEYVIVTHRRPMETELFKKYGWACCNMGASLLKILNRAVKNGTSNEKQEIIKMPTNIDSKTFLLPVQKTGQQASETACENQQEKTQTLENTASCKK
jgi:hypothetical protein